MKLDNIDNGNSFDWGKTSADYAKYRDIYPEEFYKRIVNRGLCTYREEYDINVHFTREGWHGRMRACRGVGASLPEEKLKMWEKEHYEMLLDNADEEFDILHFVSMAELTLR